MSLSFRKNKEPKCIFVQIEKKIELWPYYQKHVNQIILNRTTLWILALQILQAFVQILLIVNLSLNQTLLTFFLCVGQTLMTQLILAISLWEIQASAYEKQGRATITRLVTKFRGYRCVKNRTPPNK